MAAIRYRSVEAAIPIEHSFQKANGPTVHVAQTGVDQHRFSDSEKPGGALGADEQAHNTEGRACK
ncbi:hypothetical protein JQ557_20785 [Bradyrhizobium sp. U87765 SZCCT0131]|uniref:hypothetical protein n=1 Tax=unclassified Bradyrhizobium TaxID=2631580 RepID=UPI001BA44574|nr:MULTISPECIES: hypothetical protein [unclassified Bradyrhizobium]MBR1220450.1 hypothetical protein [Bradyrhizobium sp. U87765 SZCCT0131]MBR1263095.1 hypothetical protein [Bradyrhizobium sp. U87765 SZCCT0134]MBR1307022.1 hypothetical protein [Bradyrhizobium sp. U87765 SZCCT0110]MBR1323090.1 hypothetical protein [Bradyrhizobium sp. U87765 SZCCT0109]MBR1345976.1 hypothetical protein [Bradyrhizobium sp. U87765 SZCCT0048]